MRNRLLALAVTIVVAGVPGATAAYAQTAAPTRRPDVIFVPTPEPVVEAMLQVANVTKNDVVFDLGCGDGRIPVTAAKKYGAHGFCFDIDPERIKEANANAKTAGVTGRVKFIRGDLFEADISEATVVTLYLLTDLNIKLRPKLMRDLNPGTRVVSHAFNMGDWKPERQASIRGTTVYLWRIPPRAS
jgi:precorrin-6B methylase 2